METFEEMPQRRRPRRWVAVALLVSVSFAMLGAVRLGTGGGTTEEGGTASSQQDDIDELVPAPDVAVNALQFETLGWTLTNHVESAVMMIDAMSCSERAEAEALAGRGVVRETHEGSGGVFASLTHAQFADAATAFDLLAGFVDLRDCEGLNLDDYEQLDLDAGPGVEVLGHRRNGSAQLVATADRGQAVLVRIGNDDRDEVIDAVVAALGSFLRGETDRMSVDASATPLDDLDAALGDDPFGLVSDGWTTVTYELAPYASGAWPVCGPAPAVMSLEGAPWMTLAAVSSARQSVLIQVIEVADAAVRRELGAAFVADHDCPPSSLPFVDESEVSSDAAAGRWRRDDGDLVWELVVPPIDTAAPFVAIVVGDGEMVARFADRAERLLVGSADG